eukprot:6189109-Amphidinium_carterae.1
MDQKTKLMQEAAQARDALRGVGYCLVASSCGCRCPKRNSLCGRRLSLVCLDSRSAGTGLLEMFAVMRARSEEGDPEAQ